MTQPYEFQPQHSGLDRLSGNVASQRIALQINGGALLYGTATPSVEGFDGDFYLRTSTSFIYGPKAAGVWPDGTSLVGATGPAGPIGPVGATGLQGPVGPTGAVGPVGPAGATGPVGNIGPQGPQGTTGSIGPAGTDGKTVRSGSGVPSNGLGVDGDFYVNIAANTIYGPKTAGAWGASTSLVGPAGATGPQGPIGVTGPAGNTGAQGAVGPQGPIGITGPTGATGPQGQAGPQGPVGPPGSDGNAIYFAIALGGA
jgi:Collagen triple helix repeat (20 copies)